MNPNWLVMVPWLLSVVLTSFSQKKGQSFPEKLHFQPPGYVFAIVWTLLYLLLGLYLKSLVQTKKTSFLLFLFTANMIDLEGRLPIMADAERILLVETFIPYRPAFDVGVSLLTFENFTFTRPRYAGQVPFNPNVTVPPAQTS